MARRKTSCAEMRRQAAMVYKAIEDKRIDSVHEGYHPIGMIDFMCAESAARDASKARSCKRVRELLDEAKEHYKRAMRDLHEAGRR